MSGGNTLCATPPAEGTNVAALARHAGEIKDMDAPNGRPGGQRLSVNNCLIIQPQKNTVPMTVAKVTISVRSAILIPFQNSIMATFDHEQPFASTGFSNTPCAQNGGQSCTG
jgi:hypothetical protein